MSEQIDVMIYSVATKEALLLETEDQMTELKRILDAKANYLQEKNFRWVAKKQCSSPFLNKTSS